MLLNATCNTNDNKAFKMPILLYALMQVIFLSIKYLPTNTSQIKIEHNFILTWHKSYKQAHLGMWDLRRLASVDSKSLNMVQDAKQAH